MYREKTIALLKIHRFICSSFNKNAGFAVLVLITQATQAQTPINYNLFNRSFTLPVIAPPAPQAAQFAPITINTAPQPRYNSQPGLVINPMQLIENRNQQYEQQIRQEVDQYNYQQAQQETMKDAILKDAQASFSSPDDGNLAATQSYKQAFLQLGRLDPNNFSITNAVFLVENAYYDNQIRFERFNSMLQDRVKIVKQLLRREGLSTKNNLALNYGIQKLYQQEIPFTDSGKSYVELPFKYDFDDFMGEKDYRKMFVTKMLATNTGQCHSGPLSYICIAEQLGAKAYLSLAPQHSYIQFADNAGRLQSFETTNGRVVSDKWLIHSGYITSAALKNNTYLDTLSSRGLYAQMLGDLLLGYMAKFHRYDAFADQLRQAVLQINPNNLTALIVGARQAVINAKSEWQKAGSPKQEDLPKYPDAYRAYLNMQAALDRVDSKGYQDMPKEAYQKWLKSIDSEKQRQEDMQLKANMEKQIQAMKKFREQLQKQLKQ